MTEPTPIHPDIDAVTRAIEARSRETREAYVALVRGWRRDGPALRCAGLRPARSEPEP